MKPNFPEHDSLNCAGYTDELIYVHGATHDVYITTDDKGRKFMTVFYAAKRNYIDPDGGPGFIHVFPPLNESAQEKLPPELLDIVMALKNLHS